MRVAAGILAALALAVPSSGAGGSSIGQVAFVRAGQLVVVDLDTRRERVLVRRGVEPPVRWSADGRYIAYGGRGRLAIVPVDDPGTRGDRPADAWAWAPRGTAIAVALDGSIAVYRLGRAPLARRPFRWGAHAVAWNRDGRLAVARGRELWTWTPGRGWKLVAQTPTTPDLAGYVGERVLWWATTRSNSLMADGMPLYANRRRVVASMLLRRDWIADCGGRLAVAAGFDRITTRGKRILLDGRDVSQDATRSWISPACSRDGKKLAASAGRNYVQPRFGLEHRAVWLLRPMRRQLTRPPAGASDELPRWTTDGRGVFFVRTRQVGRTLHARGKLHLARLDGSVSGPLADLGTTGNYYGQYGWADQVDVFQPR